MAVPRLVAEDQHSHLPQWYCHRHYYHYCYFAGVILAINFQSLQITHHCHHILVAGRQQSLSHRPHRSPLENYLVTDVMQNYLPENSLAILSSRWHSEAFGSHSGDMCCQDDFRGHSDDTLTTLLGDWVRVGINNSPVMTISCYMMTAASCHNMLAFRVGGSSASAEITWTIRSSPALA